QAEGFDEEGSYEMGLEPAGCGALHVLTNAAHLAGVHRIAGQRSLLEEVPQVVAVEGSLDRQTQPIANLGLVSIADRLDQQLAKGPLVEHLPENVEHLAAQSSSLGFQLSEQGQEDLPFAGAVGDQVPHVADLGLANAVDAPKPLLDPVG